MDLKSPNKDYQEKLLKERQWYVTSSFQASHFLNSRLFYSRARNDFNYIFPKIRLFKLVLHIIEKYGLHEPNILIAPIGTGDDIKYCRHITKNISGVDISAEATNKIMDSKTKVFIGDIKNMAMFPDDHLSIVITPLFFHHFVKYSFDGFLGELRRVLKPEGFFFTLEQNSLHPVCWVTRFARKIFGNISGAIEDEAPIFPPKLLSAMKKCGFRNIKIQGASFSHNRIPIWLSKCINMLTLPILNISIFKYFAWMCIFYGRK